MQDAAASDEGQSHELEKASAELDKGGEAREVPDQPPHLIGGHWYRRHSGPLPDQDWFASLESINPGSTQIILRDFTEERQHQRKMQESAIALDAEAFSEFSSYQKMRLWIAGSLALFLAASGLALILLDKAVYGFVLLVGEIAGLMGVFLVSKILDEDDLDDEELDALMAEIDDEIDENGD